MSVASQLEELIDAKDVLQPGGDGQIEERGYEVYQFFSFDIRNSTAYKRAQTDWPILVERFYEYTWERLSRDDPEFRFWKHVGDEVLAYRRINSFKEAWDATAQAHTTLDSVIDSLHNEFTYARQERVSVKGTSWLAACKKLNNSRAEKAKEQFSDRRSSDIVTMQPYQLSRNEAGLQEPLTVADFLGPSIDSGFRIAKRSAPGILALSLELAFVLCNHLQSTRKKQDHCVFCRVVDFAEFNGIWRDRPYPIIWYRPEADGFQAFKHFNYDDAIQLKRERDCYVNSDSEKANLSAASFCVDIETIARDVGIAPSLQLIKELLEAGAVTPAKADSQKLKSVAPLAHAVEIHCAAVCCAPTEKKVLVAKRKTGRKLLADTWEFGCAQLTAGNDYQGVLRSTYLSIFGLNLEFPTGKCRHISTYFIDDKGAPGVIFPARATSVQSQCNSAKHSEIRWVTLDEAKRLEQSENTVPGFVDNIREALDRIHG